MIQLGIVGLEDSMCFEKLVLYCSHGAQTPSCYVCVLCRMGEEREAVTAPPLNCWTSCPNQAASVSVRGHMECSPSLDFQFLCVKV